MAGDALPTKSLGGSTASGSGYDGGTPGSTSNGKGITVGNVTNSMGGAGGNGGTGGNQGGSGGSALKPSASCGSIRHVTTAVIGFLYDPANSAFCIIGGGGGGGGGGVVILVYDILIEGIGNITANGGIGGVNASRDGNTGTAPGANGTAGTIIKIANK